MKRKCTTHVQVHHASVVSIGNMRFPGDIETAYCMICIIFQYLDCYSLAQLTNASVMKHLATQYNTSLFIQPYVKHGFRSAYAILHECRKLHTLYKMHSMYDRVFCSNPVVVACKCASTRTVAELLELHDKVAPYLHTFPSYTQRTKEEMLEECLVNRALAPGSCLCIAIHTTRLDLLDVLLKHGATLAVRSQCGRAAIQYAVYRMIRCVLYRFPNGIPQRITWSIAPARYWDVLDRLQTESDLVNLPHAGQQQNALDELMHQMWLSRYTTHVICEQFPDLIRLLSWLLDAGAAFSSNKWKLLLHEYLATYRFYIDTAELIVLRDHAEIHINEHVFIHDYTTEPTTGTGSLHVAQGYYVV